MTETMAPNNVPVLFSPVATACGTGNGCGIAVERAKSVKIGKSLIFDTISNRDNQWNECGGIATLEETIGSENRQLPFAFAMILNYSRLSTDLKQETVASRAVVNNHCRSFKSQPSFNQNLLSRLAVACSRR